MNNLSLYRVISPKPHHKEFLNCIGITSLVSLTGRKDRICLKFRTNSGYKFDKSFVADEFNLEEIEQITDKSVEQFWNNDEFVFTLIGR